MKPTQELSHEHQAILLGIRILEKMSDRLLAGQAVDPSHLEKAVDFIKVFADKCHHGKEEDLLFPAMEKAGIPRTGGPIGVMLNEHAAGRNYVKAMAESIPGIKKGDKAAARTFAENARNYGALLAVHIGKEDNILYPMADARLTPAQQKELASCFAEVEENIIGHDKHEEYHRLLKELETVYLA
jgi:hemerythrin-like domain-containing protein